MSEYKFRVAGVAREASICHAMITLLYNETPLKVGLETIEKICLIFKCVIGDLLELETSPQSPRIITETKESLDADY